jgi:hypothetical protein
MYACIPNAAFHHSMRSILLSEGVIMFSHLPVQ